jgi:diguanylate cyclase (GGDEF)-like protein
VDLGRVREAGKFVTRFVQSRLVARTTTAVLALGLFILASLALISTATTERATARVSAVTATGDAWGHLFDHINLEEDLMHAYLAVLDDGNRQSFAQTIGGAEPILESLKQAPDANQRQVALVAQAYQSYVVTLHAILDAAQVPTTLEARTLQGETAAATVRQLVSASEASERRATVTFNESVERSSRGLRVAATIAFSACAVLLGLCWAVLVGYQRRVERQAAANEHGATHDVLTGLANRTMLSDRIGPAISSEQGDGVGLLLIDLDGFKDVNDTLGHNFGDSVLQMVAARLAASVRDGDTVARLGGDEFAVLLPGISSVEEAVALARRLLAALLEPIKLDEYTLEVGSSIGVSMYPIDCDNPDQLLQHADIAMYTAKRDRLGVAAYEQSQNSYHPKQLTLLAELRKALTGDEIMLHYQPKVNTSTGCIVGVEALIRWQHPIRGLLGAMEFVPLAEQSGLIDQLTFRVLRDAIEQCQSWQRAGLELPVAINVSARNLTDPDFVEKVRALLRDSQILPSMLTFEITETAVINDHEQALSVLHEIRAMGLGLSIDDFGTGYSSMVYLQEMPITELKIDRCFVSQIDTEANKAIVHAVLDLARHLQLKVVAEGVEDQRTRDELSALGCAVSQGYLFGKPVPAADLVAWIDSHGKFMGGAQDEFEPVGMRS